MYKRKFSSPYSGGKILNYLKLFGNIFYLARDTGVHNFYTTDSDTLRMTINNNGKVIRSKNVKIDQKNIGLERESVLIEIILGMKVQIVPINSSNEGNIVGMNFKLLTNAVSRPNPILNIIKPIDIKAEIA